MNTVTALTGEYCHTYSKKSSVFVVIINKHGNISN